MTRGLMIILLMFASSYNLQAQIGTGRIGISSIGKDTTTVVTMGNAATPKCPMPGPCNSGCAVYTFIGAGNWNIEGNWEAGVMPPSTLVGCAQIVINPMGNQECLMNIPLQVIQSGAIITVIADKKLRIPERLVRQ